MKILDVVFISAARVDRRPGRRDTRQWRRILHSLVYLGSDLICKGVSKNMMKMRFCRRHLSYNGVTLSSMRVQR